MGLDAALDLIFHEGIDQVLARHQLIKRMVHAAVTCWSQGGALKFLASDPASRSASVTAIEVGPGVNPEALRTLARERFDVALAGGLGSLAGRVFRIGHMGDINAPMILGCLGGVEAALRVQQVPIGSGAMQAAVACLVAA
jgi:alanine-glyoxylate transaminase/serine-glyoxylate transaminase/serine-pyruvate transaminase